MKDDGIPDQTRIYEGHNLGHHKSEYRCSGDRRALADTVLPGQQSPTKEQPPYGRAADTQKPLSAADLCPASGAPRASQEHCPDVAVQAPSAELHRSQT